MNNELKWELALFTSSLFFAIAVVSVKYISHTFTWLFLIESRFIIAIIIWFIMLRLTKQKFIIIDKKTWILRGVIWCISMALFFTAISMTSSWRATALYYIYPIFTGIFWFLFFKEKIHLNNIISIILCISWIWFIFYDGSNYSTLGNIIWLLWWISCWLATHYIKLSSEKNNPIVVYLAVCFFGLVFLPFSAPQVVNLTIPLSFIVLLIWISGFIGKVLQTYALKHIKATVWSIMTYFTVPLVIILSYFIVDEEFKFKFFVWTVLIIFWLVINSSKGKTIFQKMFKQI